MKKIRIILPVYNESETIQNFYEELSSEILEIKNYQIKILFVIDKSLDQTETLITKIVQNNENCEAIVMSKRFGHQQCLFAGLDFSKNFDAVITMDADFQHPVKYIKLMLSEFNNEKYNIINMVRSNNKKTPFLKKIGTFFFYKIINFFDLKNLNKNAADFRIIDNKVLNTLTNFPEKDLFLRGIFSDLGFAQKSLAYEYEKRRLGKSKYNYMSLLLLAIKGIVSFSSKPLFLIFFLGIFLMLISILLIFVYIFDYFLLGSSSLPPGYTTTVLLILFFGSIQVFILGIIGIYISVIFKEVKNRPRYIIEKILQKNI